MSQEVRVVARSFEVADNNTEEMTKDFEIFSGKAAGICYMPDDYMENGIQNIDKAIKRASSTAQSGHHSVWEHPHISLVIKTNKMIAMILNSLGVYATSEKSARYTKMTPETELELQLYNKWEDIFKNLILNRYPNINDKELNTRFKKVFESKEGKKTDAPTIINGQFEHIDGPNKMFFLQELDRLKDSNTLPSCKLAQENARYIISVFTPTTLMYTVSYRQAMLIVSYFELLQVNLEHQTGVFETKLLKYVREFTGKFKQAVGEIKLQDTKNQYIRFLEAQHIGEIRNNKFVCYDTFGKSELYNRFEAKKMVCGDSYTLVYWGSLAMLAQAQRHRTIRYTMFFKAEFEKDNYFYTPNILIEADNESLVTEWINDLNSIKQCIPQATLVRITEQGLFEDFALKCKERLCGKAQLEIVNRTADNLIYFYINKKKLCTANKQLLKYMIDNSKIFENNLSIGIAPRCKFSDYTCKEGCFWGPDKALDRLI